MVRLVAKVDDRLVVEAEVARRDARFQVAPVLDLGHRGFLHGWLEDLEPALAAALREVHRDIGVADEVIGGLVAGAGHGHADAGMGDQAVPADVERFAQQREDSLRDTHRDLRVRARPAAR